ncbi:MAG: CDP-glycerol glycerophosphotransferase family protein [Turicibacter sp.]|nr:CDP-glycerol glycerophosphotransferase family protein [Turicibacter sp.]
MRELAVSLYLIAIKMVFQLFKILPLQKKVVFVASFPENNLFIYRELKASTDWKPVFLCHPRTVDAFKETGETALLFETGNAWQEVKGIYHLATARRVIVDNYYGFLSAVKFKQSVKRIQIWHAAGAIKQFGLMDPSNKLRSPNAMGRFKSVYQNFQQIVVGSDFMADIFTQAFGTPTGGFLPTGIPRTDFFYDPALMEAAKESFYQRFPDLKTKKIILYAPTFRHNEGREGKFPLDINLMRERLGDGYALVLRLHPKVRGSSTTTLDFLGFAFDGQAFPDINSLLPVTDILISDYSSIPMEFSLLERQMIFYPYDLEDYQKNTGLWEDYLEAMPGPVVFSTEGLIDAILTNEVDLAQIRRFKEKWNMYSKGHSSSSFVEAFIGEENH